MSEPPHTPPAREPSRRLANPRWMGLLAALEDARSITAAARAAGLSYKGAWDAIDAMNNLAGQALVETVVGGRGGGGARLTDRGREVLAAYRRLDTASRHFAVSVAPGSGTDQGGADASDAVLLARLALRASARNQLAGQVLAIRPGAVNDEVQVRLSSGAVLVATITRESTALLGLAPDQPVVALIKSTAVLVAAGAGPFALSARNQFPGTVTRCLPGAVNTEVVIAIGAGQSLAAIITRAAADALALVPGAAACAVFDASAVILLCV